MTALLIAEHDNVTLKPGTARALTAALKMTEACDILVAGNDCEGVAREAAKLSGVNRVLLAEAPQLAQELPEELSETVAEIAADYTHILFVNNTVGKAAMPRVAALLDISPISDIHSVLGPKTFEREIYAGSLLSEVEILDEKVIGTIRITAFAPTKAGEASAPIVPAPVAPTFTKARFVSFNEHKSDRPELVSARVVVSGGRGLHDKAGFAALEAFADTLGAAVGATRTAVDMGLAPNDWQVGQTGKIIAPELYFAVGISGAMQHTAGIKDSQTVVAINDDPEAPIFEVADLGLVMDAVTAVNGLREKLS